MNNNEYDLLKKQEYLSALGLESINEDTPADIKNEWLARLNQIKSGHLLGLSHEQIDVYCALEGYEKREFVKSCVHEGVNKDIIAKIIECDDLEDMKLLKTEHYKANYILGGINNKVNTIRGVLDDCEQKFSLFEKYLAQFSKQVENKDKEITSLKAEINDYKAKLEQAIAENRALMVENKELVINYNKVMEGSNSKEIIVTKVIKHENTQPQATTTEEQLNTETDTTHNLVVANTKDKNKFISNVKQFLKFGPNTANEGIVVPNEENTDKIAENSNVGSVTDVAAPTKTVFTTEEKAVTINGDINSYILNANLSSEQLVAIAKCFTLGIEDMHIISMIENNLSAPQITNFANVVMAKKNAEERKLEELKKKAQENNKDFVPAPQKINKPQKLSESAQWVDDDNEDIEDYADEYEGTEDMPDDDE